MAPVAAARHRRGGSRFRGGPGLASVVVFSALLTLCACFWGPKKRPAGFLNLGNVAQLAQHDETFFSDLKILLRRDSGGFYAMSTACTYDLSALIFSERDGKLLWRSQFTESAYSADGSVAHGPTRYPLPYYKLELAPGTVGGPPDTLFVEVGVERPSAWRLPLPKGE